MGIEFEDCIYYSDFVIENIDNSKSGLLFKKNDGSMVDFKTFSLDIRYYNPSQWYIKDIDDKLVDFYTDSLYTKDGKNVDMSKLLEESDLKLFSNETYDKFLKIKTLKHFMEALDDFEKIHIKKDINISVNTIEKKGDELEIGYSIKKHNSKAEPLSIDAFIKIGNYKNCTDIEIVGDIFDNVLKNIQKSLENENIIIKTENDYDDVYEDFYSISAGKWLKTRDYFAVNDGIINEQYPKLSKEKSLAYHDGRMYYFDSPYLKELYDELENRGFTKDDIDQKYIKALDFVLEYSQPFDYVNYMLQEQGLADKFMIISRKGKDNFIFAQILNYEDNCDICDFLLVEAKPSKDEINQCLMILKDVKNDLFYSAKEEVLLHIEDEENNEKQQYDEKKETLAELNLDTNSKKAECTNKIRKK